MGLKIKFEIIMGRQTRPGQAGVMSKTLCTLSETILCIVFEINGMGGKA